MAARTSRPVVGRALAELHARPAEPWTIASLAAEVHLSRATLARRFTELVGEPPLAYLTRWRMDLAARRLKATTEPVQSIARAVGYSSEYAFNRAFTRHRGQPPGRYRRAA
jgi:AraC-like DNA-binding protein